MGEAVADFFKKLTGRIANYFKNLEKGQRTRLIIFAALAVAIIAAASVLLNQKSYTVLYSGMDAADAGEVLSELSDMGVDAKAKGTDTILVESEKADSVRMQLAAEGYPKSGFNFDIFSKASGLGTTDMEKRIYYQFQLQDNLSNVIKKMSKIDDAVVNISLADESDFVLSSDEKPANASVLLKLKDGATLTEQEARTIAELVSKSVSNLSLENVRIVDSNMKLYSLEEDPQEVSFENMGTQLQLEQAVKERLKDQVISLLTPVFGEEHVLASVNVTLNFDRQTTSSVEFNPPVEGSSQGLAVSIKQLAEAVKGNGDASGVPGVDMNGIGSLSSYPQVGTDENSVYSKVSTEANLELNETRTQIESAQGQIRDLSVAVVIDNSNLDEDYSQSVRNLVANAIGVKADNISVEMLPFATLQNAQDNNDINEAFNMQKEILNTANNAATTQLIIIAATVVLVLIIVIVAIISLRKKPDVPVTYSVSEEPGSLVNVQAGSGDILPVQEAAAEPAPAPEPEPEEYETEPEYEPEPEYEYEYEYEPEPEIPEIPEITEKEDTTLIQLERYIDKNPEAVAQLLRSWISDDSK